MCLLLLLATLSPSPRKEGRKEEGREREKKEGSKQKKNNDKKEEWKWEDEDDSLHTNPKQTTNTDYDCKQQNNNDLLFFTPNPPNPESNLTSFLFSFLSFLFPLFSRLLTSSQTLSNPSSSHTPLAHYTQNPYTLAYTLILSIPTYPHIPCCTRDITYTQSHPYLTHHKQHNTHQQTTPKHKYNPFITHRL